VYQGEWQGAPIALKKLKSSEGFEEFAKEANVLGYVSRIIIRFINPLGN
jgi:hypothetical protein